MTRRRTDRWSLGCVVVGMLLLSTYTVVAALAQTTLQDYVDQTQTTRIAALEQLNTDRRLAVLEANALDAAQTRYLLYGVMGAVVAQLIAQLIQIRGQSTRRWRSQDDDDV